VDWENMVSLMRGLEPKVTNWDNSPLGEWVEKNGKRKVKK
jgi:hypothetical protein